MQLEVFKEKYQALQSSLEVDFLKKPDAVKALVQRRSDEIDSLLCDIWRGFEVSNQLCLAAVGGYGRRELHLYSDIDLLILIPSGSHNVHQENLSKFLTFLWDVGLEVGHATRDITDCVANIHDLSVATNLLESRILIGKESLFLRMKVVIKSNDWSSRSFFVGKQKEQHERHLNYSNTAYNLEPNLKESPGGLRDIQTVAWVAKWYFDVDLLSDLVEKEYLTQGEYDLLIEAQSFLWKVRFALHIIAQRREDRVAFQYQRKVASVLGYEEGDSIAVEQFMRDYYQTATKVARLNDILLQLFEESVLHVQHLNARFVISHGYIYMTDSKVFAKQPSAFIEIFLLVAKHNYVSGISADTLRQMQKDIDLIGENYYKKRQNNRLFIELLQQKQGVNKALKLMNRYGVLERYIPAFGKITGLMQYDLFHAYTVDQHTLFVIRNLRRFFIGEFAQEFALCSEIATDIVKPELLFLAGLFHDIAKGRGGDHATLGAKDAQDFLKHHSLKAKDVALVSSLVEQHLLMTQVAQKQDLDDFDVIEQFAKTVKSVEFLEFLYLLTVADIRATKEDLWNSWKDSLLKKLFYKTKEHLQKTPKAPSITAQVKVVKQALAKAVIQQGYDRQKADVMLDTLPKDYFLRYQVDDILWHLQCLTRQSGKAIKVLSRLSEHNVVDIFVHSEDSKGLFFKLVSIIEKLGLDIVDAKILTSKDNKTYNTISVLQDEILEHTNINKVIEEELTQLVQSGADVKQMSDKYAHYHFDHKMEITFSHNDTWNLTEVEVNVIDKQGLLSNIAYIFYQLDFHLVNARISTMGERVEDVFFISNADNKPLSKLEQQTLSQYLQEKL
ncbi:[Protein-PII] uridylyltransferase (EC / [Protein-PII]-UMP uridylyl-removing enzyme [Bathymodiolus thermophilus thioautotrophic gill symbiont]|uniref:[protein-PII] uridylyltransferase n=1 Tax=Bathymodiolus thermophilus thioautotrophic gill symbiont TaxID=2360 RepID=UPI001A3508A2|nr:[protein-PII] uridylyltransferase [Bathymodiolus thermophilus thioautotrophic gill symbiont]CAB5504151.1 [Protein-PII] uridylyltransferase (EC / [Protein-PII]-UMP uridylyl-removing enzyme [Bathymodiolus thermophilus thioautotrophic gill symbiont]